PFSGLDCLQHPPHFPFCVPSKDCPPTTFSLNGGLGECTTSPSSSNNRTGSPARPFTRTSICPYIISSPSTGELSPDGSNLRCGSGSHSPGHAVPPGSLAAIPHFHRHHLLGAAAIICASARASTVHLQASHRNRTQASHQF
ncbi:uncharacterized protein BXZ73DRAFT_11380, partial [Epithele typhae]|uniref:uncharacterized protein n=1 Tax=Epithele typhae TaxID=378194 RepID=UPI002008DD55